MVAKKDLIEVNTDIELETWFGNALVCYYKEGSSLEKVVSLLRAKNIGDLVTSRFDSFSCLISRFKCRKDWPLNEHIQQSLKESFENVVPWSREIKQSIRKRFEIVGIPYISGQMI